MRDIFDAPSREDAEELKGKVVKKFEKIAPEFVSWLEDNLDEGLTVFDFPRSWWRRIRTINGLERLHREIRRRTRVVGIFPHEASALRLISAVLAEIHEEWLTGRQYLNLAGWKKQVEQSFPTGPQGKLQKNSCLTLRQRGDLTIWVSEEAQSVWSAPRRTSRGDQRRYSDLAIETCLTLRTAYRLARPSSSPGCRTACGERCGAARSALLRHRDTRRLRARCG